MRATWILALAFGATLAVPHEVRACPSASVQRGQEPEYEDFEDVDPYTQGDRALLDALGYVNFGPFPWAEGRQTGELEETMGGVEFLWVETEHFKLGSSLTTYKIGNDKRERQLLREELARLKQKLGRSFKPPKKELDPWLRLHLFAQRLEELYDDFMERFGLSAADFPANAPYLGTSDKFLVLLCQRKSSFARYVKQYIGVDADFSYIWRFPAGGMFFGANAEAMIEATYGSDTAMHCATASSVINCMLGGYRVNWHQVPVWFSYGLGHWYSRRIDPRWTLYTGHAPDAARREKEWKWEPRVQNLVKNDFFVSSREMFGWTHYEQIDIRAHMVIWSRVEFLMDELEGNRKALVEALCQRWPAGEGEVRAAALSARGAAALETAYGMTPEDFDEAWAKHVRKRYSKR